jgi:hypothetical protein
MTRTGIAGSKSRSFSAIKAYTIYSSILACQSCIGIIVRRQVYTLVTGLIETGYNCRILILDGKIRLIKPKSTYASVFRMSTH